MIFRAGALLPPPLKKAAKYAYYTATWRRLERDCIVLNSIQKSGLNFFRIFLANYLMLYYENIDAPLNYDQVNSEIFPNSREALMEGHSRYRAPHPMLKKTPFRDMVSGHRDTAIEYCDGRVIFLYRNPLDTIISTYFYKWKNRPGIGAAYEHPRQVIDQVLDDFTVRYAMMRRLSRDKANVVMLSYEAMMQAPVHTFTTLFHWLGLPVDCECLARALAFSDIKVVRAYERQRGKAIHSPENFIGYFTRSGAIGQWKDYFNDADLDRIRARLGALGIYLSEFVTEPGDRRGAPDGG